MSFTDIFKKSFLEGWEANQIGGTAMVATMGIAAVIGLFIFFFYRVSSQKAMYNKGFNISLAGVCVITAAIILTVQSSIVISLGMVGALSIVRFRTAIKDPLDLMYLFWAISCGIVCGAGLAEFAIILSLTLAVGIAVLQKIPDIRTPMLLAINVDTGVDETLILNVVKKYAVNSKVVSRALTPDLLDLTIELRAADEQTMLLELQKIEGVHAVTLLSQEGR